MHGWSRAAARAGMVVTWAGLCVGFAGATPAPTPELFAYDPGAITYRSRLASRTTDFDLIEVSYASPLPTSYPENATVYASFFRPPRPAGESIPAVIVLHVLETTNAGLSRQFCTRLARAGIGALLITLPYHMRRTPAGYRSGELMTTADPVALREAMRQAVMDVRCGVDWLMRQPEVDAQSIGLVGLSLGAVVGTLASQVETRFRAAALVVGAARLARIVANSGMLLKLQRQLRSTGITTDDLERELRAVDAVNYVGVNPDCRIYMINALHDWAIPEQAARETHAAFGQAVVQWLNAGHFTIFASPGPLSGEIIRFLRSALGPTPRDSSPHRLYAVNLKLGFLNAAHRGGKVALLAEAYTISTRARLAVDFGALNDSLWAGVSARPAENLSVGVGTPVLTGEWDPQLYWMAHVTF